MKQGFWNVVAGCLLLVITLLFALPGTAHAEETPVTVPLAYVVNLSNWGPTTATGTALVWRVEAEVQVRVQGLPVLNHQLYAVWLVNPQAGQFLTVGRFNVAADGTAELDVSLPGSLPDGYDLVLITVQPDPEAVHTQPSELRSIAGYFAGNSAVQRQVTHLPDTGAHAIHPPFESGNTVKPAVTYSSWLFAVPLALVGMVFFARRLRLQRRYRQQHSQ